ncbi:MAG: hypothetical protein V4735_04440 [Pseudomonadota bacterium]
MTEAQIVLGFLVLAAAVLVYHYVAYRLTFGFFRWFGRWPKWLRLFLVAPVVLVYAAALIVQLWYAATKQAMHVGEHGLVTLQDQPVLFWSTVAIDIGLLVVVPTFIVLVRWFFRRLDKQRVQLQLQRARDLPNEAIIRSADDR